MDLRQKMRLPGSYLKMFLKWGALGVLIGALVGLFCSATNATFAAMVLSVEMFGSTNLHAFALVCVICFLLSGHGGLYSSQLLRFAKTSMSGYGRL